MEIIVASDLHPSTKFYLVIRTILQLFDRMAMDTLTFGLRGCFGDDVQLVHEAMSPLYKRYERLWQKLLREGQESGIFAKIGHPKIVVFAILGLCNWTARWFDPKKHVSLVEVAEIYYALIGGGLLLDGATQDISKKLHLKAVHAEAEAFLELHGLP